MVWCDFCFDIVEAGSHDPFVSPLVKVDSYMVLIESFLDNLEEVSKSCVLVGEPVEVLRHGFLERRLPHHEVELFK